MGGTRLAWGVWLGLLAGAGCGNPGGDQTPDSGGRPGEWVRTFGVDHIFGSGGQSIAPAPNGDVVVGGSYAGALAVGGDPFSASDNGGVFVARYTRQGEHVWSHGYAGSSFTTAGGVAVEAGGAVWFGGCFGGDLDLGGGSLPSNGVTDVFVLRLSDAGAHSFSQHHGTASFNCARKLIAATPSTMAVTGYYGASLSFGGSMLSSFGGDDLFLAVLDSMGAHVASRGFGGSGRDRPAALAVEPTGDLLVAGSFETGGVSIDFGGGSLAAAGDRDAFVARLSPDGAHVWSRSFGGAGRDEAHAVAVDENGDVLVAGSLFGVVDLGGGPRGAANSESLFVMKLTAADGAHVWSRAFGGEEIEVAQVVTQGGASVLGLSFRNNLALEGTPLSSDGSQDMALVTISATDGGVVSARAWGGSGDDALNDLALDSEGFLLLTGSFQATVDFDVRRVSSVGARDVFVLRIAP